MGQACASKQSNVPGENQPDMGMVSPVMIAQKVDVQPLAGGAANAEPMKAQAAAAAVASREASPMDMPQPNNAMAMAQNSMEMAMPAAEVVPMAQPAGADGWATCNNCDVTHEVVSEGVYRDLRTGEMVVDSQVHRNSQTQPVVHEQVWSGKSRPRGRVRTSVMYEDAPVQEIIEEAVAPAPYTHAPRAPLAQEAPAHDEGNNIIVGAMAVRRGADVDDMAAPQQEEPAAPENQGRGAYRPKLQNGGSGNGIYLKEGEPSVVEPSEVEVAYAHIPGGEPSEDVEAEPEKRRKKRGKKKKRSARLPLRWF